MPPFDKASLRREWQIFLLALGFLSRIPVPQDPDFSPEKLDGTARYFPLVGLLIGGVTAIALLVFFALFNNPLLAVLLSMAVGLLLTGAFHEDGLADSADGFGGGWRRDDVLRIMKDSRIGSYGTGAQPYFAGIGPALSNGSGNHVVTGIAWGGTVTAAGRKGLCFDNIYTDHAHEDAADAPLVMQGGSVNGNPLWRSCLRRYKAVDAFGTTPLGTLWDNSNDRVSAMYGDTLDDFLYEKVFTDLSGWTEGYRLDRVHDDNGTLYPKICDDRSHGTYIQAHSMGITVRDIFMLRPSFSAMQIRPAGSS